MQQNEPVTEHLLNDQDENVIDKMLNDVSYDPLDDANYVPSQFAIEFIIFIKLVNGEKGEEHDSPVMHYKMLDQVAGPKQNIANMCSRGLAKSALFGEYFILYLAVYVMIPGFGKVPYALYVSDSMDNGVKKMRNRIERRRLNSPFLMKYLPEARITENRWYFKNKDNTEFVCTGHGAKALSLDSTLYTQEGITTIGTCSIGDFIYGPDGKLAPIIAKSEIFNKPVYQLELADGRILNVSEDHINSVLKYGEERNLTTQELLEAPLFRTKNNGTHNYTFQIVNTEPLAYPYKKLPDAYTLGLLLGDGSLKADKSTTIHCHKDDLSHYLGKVPYVIGTQYLNKRNSTTITFSLLGAYKDYETLGVYGISCAEKFIPEPYFYASINQRLALLNGLIDTDGSISKEGKVTFCSTSPALRKGVIRLVRSLGGTAKEWKETQVLEQHAISAKVGIWLNFNTASLPRKACREKFNKSVNVAIVGIHCIDTVPSQCIAIDSVSHQFLANDYVRTHNTGVRGTVELNSRPVVAILDDLISDQDARSDTVIASVEDTVYKAVDFALHPTRNKIIWSGTPFNARDPLYKAIESGAWYTNLFPVCESFPCTREEFRGAWPDRFTYDYVLSKYTKALKLGKLDTFNQELMLRIMSEEDRLINDGEIIWYNRDNVLRNKHLFNFYITTDFATEAGEANDFSVISVWAYNSNGDWLWVDGICKRQLMDQNIIDLFRLVQMYKPQEVGIEVSGQQGGFIPWIREKQLDKNTYFNFASEGNSNKPGIRPATGSGKMVRFNIVLPWFKAHKIWWPESMKDSPEMRECMSELTLASVKGFKAKHDDFIDTISQLASLKPWKPSADVPKEAGDGNHLDLWGDDDEDSGNKAALGSYIV